MWSARGGRCHFVYQPVQTGHKVRKSPQVIAILHEYVHTFVFLYTQDTIT